MNGQPQRYHLSSSSFVNHNQYVDHHHHRSHQSQNQESFPQLLPLDWTLVIPRIKDIILTTPRSKLTTARVCKQLALQFFPFPSPPDSVLNASHALPMSNRRLDTGISHENGQPPSTPFLTSPLRDRIEGILWGLMFVERLGSLPDGLHGPHAEDGLTDAAIQTTPPVLQDTGVQSVLMLDSVGCQTENVAFFTLEDAMDMAMLSVSPAVNQSVVPAVAPVPVAAASVVVSQLQVSSSSSISQSLPETVVPCELEINDASSDFTVSSDYGDHDMEVTDRTDEFDDAIDVVHEVSTVPDMNSAIPNVIPVLHKVNGHKEAAEETEAVGQDVFIEQVVDVMEICNEVPLHQQLPQCPEVVTIDILEIVDSPDEPSPKPLDSSVLNPATDPNVKIDDLPPSLIETALVEEENATGYFQMEMERTLPFLASPSIDQSAPVEQVKAMELELSTKSPGQTLPDSPSIVDQSALVDQAKAIYSESLQKVAEPNLPLQRSTPADQATDIPPLTSPAGLTDRKPKSTTVKSEVNEPAWNFIQAIPLRYLPAWFDKAPINWAMKGFNTASVSHGSINVTSGFKKEMYPFANLPRFGGIKSALKSIVKVSKKPLKVPVPAMVVRYVCNSKANPDCKAELCLKIFSDDLNSVHIFDVNPHGRSDPCCKPRVTYFAAMHFINELLSKADYQPVEDWSGKLEAFQNDPYYQANVMPIPDASLYYAEILGRAHSQRARLIEPTHVSGCKLIASSSIDSEKACSDRTLEENVGLAGVSDVTLSAALPDVSTSQIEAPVLDIKGKKKSSSMSTSVGLQHTPVKSNRSTKSPVSILSKNAVLTRYFSTASSPVDSHFSTAVPQSASTDIVTAQGCDESNGLDTTQSQAKESVAQKSHDYKEQRPYSYGAHKRAWSEDQASLHNTQSDIFGNDVDEKRPKPADTPTESSRSPVEEPMALETNVQVFYGEEGLVENSNPKRDASVTVIKSSSLSSPDRSQTSGDVRAMPPPDSLIDVTNNQTRPVI